MSLLRTLGAPAMFVLMAGVLAGCPDDKTCPPRVVTTSQECVTTQDCIDSGYRGLICLNGTCNRGCTRDEDCLLDDPAAENKECTSDKPDDTFICEAEVCAVGCPSVACADGETCVEGRCTIFFESFELPMGQEVVTLKNLGWNDIPRDLENRETLIVFSGAEGCNRGDERCAGPAADGARFVSLERVPTAPVGTPENDVTCRACACCLECRLNPPRSMTNSTIPNCPGRIDPPEFPMCEGPVPNVCSTVCTACDACTNAMGRMVDNDGLLTCEQQAAPKTCSGCVAYDQCVSNALAAHNCDSPAEPCRAEADCRACVVRMCDAMRPACFQCRDAVQCEIDTPGSATCRQLKMDCDAQGNDGCYTTPIARNRSELTDDEQALTSPKIPKIAGASGRVVVELEYVPFNIGDTWTKILQGKKMEEWLPNQTQEVKLQLCGGSCEQAASWMDAVSFPASNQKQNGLLFAGQTEIDWRSNRISVDVPEAMRTADFRLRLVPLLEDDARVAIDNVIVRRKP